MPGTALVVVPALTAVGSLEPDSERERVGAEEGLGGVLQRRRRATCIWPNAESSVCIVAAVVCRRVSGWRSTAISWVTMELTSRPLPTPADEIVPVVGVMVVMTEAAVGAGSRNRVIGSPQ